MLRTTLPICLTLLALSSTVAAQPTETAAVAARYVELQLAQDYDALRHLYADDATFFDPTADVFGGAAEDVSGADAIVALQRSWGFDSLRYTEAESFSVGEYFVTRGVLGIRSDASGPWTDLPFVMVLRVRSGKVAERTDLAEYVESFSLGDAPRAQSQVTRRVADDYLAAYLAADLEAQRRLLAEDALFQDPTAQVYGPGSGRPREGADEILAQRAQTFGNVTDFGLDVVDAFVSNHHAVYMGRTTYTLRSGARYEQPAVFVIQVEDGQVTRHWDYVDYSVGPVGG